MNNNKLAELSEKWGKAYLLEKTIYNLMKDRKKHSLKEIEAAATKAGANFTYSTIIKTLRKIGRDQHFENFSTMTFLENNYYQLKTSRLEKLLKKNLTKVASKEEL